MEGGRGMGAAAERRPVPSDTDVASGPSRQPDGKGAPRVDKAAKGGKGGKGRGHLHVQA